ncbi:MAG: helix-turn-helix transcriptional regulator [Bacteroidetes bacterium]|nr:MAG: helix-turn-helix transcriptional regulator [Bacteroidota bacterium]
MKPPLIPLSHKMLEWKDAFPSAFKGVHLPGSSVLSSVGNFGSVCIQEYRSDDFSIRFNVFDLIDRFVAKSFYKRPGICSRLVLKGRIDHEATPDIKWTIRQGQFSLNGDSGKSLRSHVETYEKNTHISFDTYFSMKLAKELLLLYPSYTPAASGITRFADLETVELAHSILRCKYDKELRLHFLKSRAKDLLFKYLLLDQQEITTEEEISESEINAIHQSAKIISTDVSKHYAIPELTKQIGFNEFRFKYLFKKIFGIGPYEYLVRKRMAKAKELLQTGLSVKEVAGLVGYRASDFTTVFRTHFGIPPSSAKQKP